MLPATNPEVPTPDFNMCNARDEDFSATNWQLLHVQLLGQVQGGPLGPKGYNSTKKGSHVPPFINDRLKAHRS